MQLLVKHGFAGAVLPVNTARATVQGQKAYASILDVPTVPDLALIAVPAKHVPQILRDCAAIGVGSAVVMSSGFGEGAGFGQELSDEILLDLADSSMRVLGPNCEGLASLHAGVALTFSPVLDTPRGLPHGAVTVLSQSGGIGFAVAHWATQAGIGINHVITTGNEIDIDIIELAECIAHDTSTSVLMLVLEGVDDPGRLASVGRTLRKHGKWGVALKLGISDAGRRGVVAHAKHDAGDENYYREIFRSSGFVETTDVDHLIDVSQMLTKKRDAQFRGPRIAILTTSGGAGILAADACEAQGLSVPSLGSALQDELSALMPEFGSSNNPVDLTAQFLSGGTFAPAIERVLDSGEVDGVILVTSLINGKRLAAQESSLEAVLQNASIPISIYAYTEPAEQSVEILNRLGVAWYTSPNRAAHALGALLTGKG